MNLLENVLYSVTAQEGEGNTLIATLSWIYPCALLDGHFPGHPIIPGACQIQIVRELSEKLLGCQTELTNVKNVKFVGLIDPQKTPFTQVDVQAVRDNAVVTTAEAAAPATATAAAAIATTTKAASPANTPLWRIKAVLRNKDLIYSKIDLCLTTLASV